MYLGLLYSCTRHKFYSSSYSSEHLPIRTHIRVTRSITFGLPCGYNFSRQFTYQAG